jgi:hypothetical protein
MSEVIRFPGASKAANAARRTPPAAIFLSPAPERWPRLGRSPVL